MLNFSPVLYGLVLLLLAMMCRPLQSYTKLPYALFIIIIGFIASEIYTFLGFDTGLLSINFHFLSQYFFIPIILFTAAYHMSPKMVLKNSIIHFLFAIPFTLISLVIVTVLLYYGINQPTAFPWLAAALTAAALAATGSHAISDYLRAIKISPRIIYILQVESLFSAILALVYVNLLMTSHVPSFNEAFLYSIFTFLIQILGGVFIGIIVGYVMLAIFKLLNESTAEIILLLTSIYLTFILCEIWQVSSSVAVFVLGLFFGSLIKKTSPSEHHFINTFFDSLYLFAITAIFLLVGTAVTWSMFKENWLAMIVGIIAVLIARAISVYGGVGLYNELREHKNYSLNDKNLLNWGGARAAFPIAIAFSIPTSLDYWWTIQSIVFGVVLFGIIIQAPLLKFFVKKHRKPND